MHIKLQLVKPTHLICDHWYIFTVDQADGSGRSPDATGSSTVKLVKPGPRSWSDMSSSYPLTTISSQGDGFKQLIFALL